jgi:quercetin dioxygenase-like cupin family protein
MYFLIFFCSWLLASVPAAQPDVTNAVPLDKEPVHHLVLENQYVRAFKVEVAPGSATLLHRHDKDYVFVTLGDSEVSNERQGEKPVTLKFKNGEARFTKGGFAHIARNLSAKPFRNVTVELLIPVEGVHPCDRKAEICDLEMSEACGVSGLVHCAESWTVIRADSFRAAETDIPAGLTTKKHSHAGPHLAIALTDVQLRNAVEGKQTVQLNIAAGDIKWIPGGFKHSLTNIGTETARIITIEFK